MSRADLHPDHLLARHRAASLTPDERAALDRHVATCVTCAYELAVGRDFARDLGAPVPDAALAAITARVQSTLATDGQRPVRRHRSVGFVVAAAVALVAATAFATTMLVTRGSLRPALGALSPTPRLAGLPRVARPDRVEPVDLSDAAVPTPATPEPMEPPAPAREHRHAHARTSHAEPDEDRDARAQELFEQAVEARRAGRYTAAAALFERLQQRYGDSDEASISQIALGRLWLDRLSQPSRALAQFEGYLAAHPRGESREDAMVGRAAALERLGRNAAAREAWEAVRDAFPHSVSAERARVRIDALR